LAREKEISMKVVFLSICALLGGLVAPSLAQNSSSSRISVPRVNLGPSRAPATSIVGNAGYPTGPTFLPYPTISTPSNDAVARQNAWAAYNAQLRQIPKAANPNRLAANSDLLDRNRFIQAPTSLRRSNFQFTDNEIRSVQSALKIRGLYSGQIDGILGPDTRRAIVTYQWMNKRSVTGQPDAWLNASLGIF
jgi:hypothetical protein